MKLTLGITVEEVIMLKRQKEKEERLAKKAFYKPIIEKTTKYKNDLKKKSTEAEKILYKELKRIGINFEFQRPYYNETFCCIVDFLIKGGFRNVVIEVDGGYHNTPEQQSKDKYRTEWLMKNRKARIIRFTNEQVLSDLHGCILDIANKFMETCRDKHALNFKEFRAIIKAAKQKTI